MTTPFETPLDLTDSLLTGPLRGPRQMLAEQEYDGHTSIHDDETAKKLGFSGGTIEGPTHFSQFVPLLHKIWGQDFFEKGCISVHYRSPVFEGEQVRAFVEQPNDGSSRAELWMEKEDGTEVLRGSASIGPEHPATALDDRIKTLRPVTKLVVLSDIKVGMKGQGAEKVTMGFEQNMGKLYPFSVKDKLKVITEDHPYYSPTTANDSPWARAIVPMEMISVLVQHSNRLARFPVRQPSVGLFADQEIRLIKGPLFLGETYELEREVVALSESRRTESFWIRTSVRTTDGELVATTLLNSATMKESFPDYDKVAAELE